MAHSSRLKIEKPVYNLFVRNISKLLSVKYGGKKSLIQRVFISFSPIFLK